MKTLKYICIFCSLQPPQEVTEAGLVSLLARWESRPREVEWCLLRSQRSEGRAAVRTRSLPSEPADNLGGGGAHGSSL